MEKRSIILAVIVGAALIFAGAGIGYGFYKGRAEVRFVTVKGLAEKEVNADLAIWPITFTANSNNLNTLQNEIDSQREVIVNFLKKEGFDESSISYSSPQIQDLEAEMRYSNKKPDFKYQAQATVTTRTNNVQLVKKTMEKTGTLVSDGILLSAMNWQNPTEFLYTGLNEIKPAMIEAATKNAREAAEKFARDSDSELGKIRRANQGYFDISDRDRNSPDVKVIRVVTTVEYYLAD